MVKPILMSLLTLACLAHQGALAQAAAAPSTVHDADLARSLGANDNGRRGIFIFATPEIETVRGWVATDPVIIRGEMAAEYHKLDGSAALMAVSGIHHKILKK